MRRRQQGLTLIELMIAMTLGMGVALAAAALLNAAKSSYLAVNDNAQVQESGRYALDLIARSLRQANYVPHDDPVFLQADLGSMSPGVHGLDNARLNERSPDISAPSANPAAHGSDVLAIRFFGSGHRGQADGSMLNCAGFAVAGPARDNSGADLEEARGWSIFYVAPDSNGEPELRCKYQTQRDGWSAAAVVRGVESFQVLYGVRNGDGLDYLNAARMSARWNEVVAVRIALLIRGERNVREAGSPVLHPLFGPGYRNAADVGVAVDEAALAPNLQGRIRKVFETTVHLRNPASPEMTDR
ncbi:PilW family protein [Herbaspirillum sp. RV1423]|uniref:PilW family protein n=1 Tax=Herbaspirillum sp. RV1423 TaxID=1443993 RepID=UPI0004B5568F|nr:PilW family protein [Herbaspirillum sp. RV1423]